MNGTSKTQLQIKQLRANWDSLSLPDRGEILHELLDFGFRQCDLATEIGQTRFSIRRALAFESDQVTPVPAPDVPRKPAGRADKSVPESRETWDVKGDTAELTKITSKLVKTLDDLKAVCEIDETEWEVERFQCNTWGVTMKSAATTEWVETKDGRRVPAFVRYDKEPVKETNYQVKAWMKRKTQIIAVRNEIATMISDAAKFAPVYAPFVRSNALSGNMLEICMPDLHLGKHAWAPETGHHDYDIHLSAATHDRALEALVARTSGYQFDQICFVVGNDFFNSDNKSNLTTKGTPQSTDTRYPKLIRVGRQLNVNAIDRLSQIAPVKVIIVPGNHDELSAFHLGEELSIWYRNNPNVEVDNSATLRKWHEFGQVMLMWTHGSEEKKDDLNGIMSSEQPAMWGRTKFREAHVGHLHKTTVNEKYGMRWRILSALCPPDEWHSRHGYVGSLRGAEAFMWNRDSGLIGTAVYTEQEANYLESKAA